MVPPAGTRTSTISLPITSREENGGFDEPTWLGAVTYKEANVFSNLPLFYEKAFELPTKN